MPANDPTRSAPGRFWGVVTRAYLLSAVGAAVGSLWLAHLLHHRTLFLDQWRIHYRLITLPFWEGVWRAHAGHRLLFLNLLYHWGNVLFAGDSEFLVAIALALVAASAFALCRAICSAPGGDRGVKRLACGLVIALLFWFGNHATLVWALGVGHGALVGASVLASLFAVARAGELRPAQPRRAQAWLVAALAPAWIATFSGAFGLAAWPTLAFACLGAGLGARRAILPLAMGGLAAGVYAFTGSGWGKALPVSALAGPAGLARAGQAALVLLGATPAYVLDFALSHDSDARTAVATLYGGAGVALWICGLAFAMARRVPLERGAIVSLGFLFFCVIAAAMVGVGRADLPASHSLVPHYVMWSSLFWAGLVALGAVASGWRRGSPGRAARVATAACVLGASALLGPSYRSGVGVAARRTQQIEEAALSVVVGVPDVERRRRDLFRDLEEVDRVASDLRIRRLNLYRHDWSHLVGTRWEDRFVEGARPGAALGLVSIRELPGEGRRIGWSVEGWAWDAEAGRPPRLVLLADESGTIRGLARFTREPDAPPAGPPDLVTRLLARVHPRLPAAAGRAAGCFGFLQAEVPPGGASALVVLADGRSVARLEARWSPLVAGYAAWRSISGV